MCLLIFLPVLAFLPYLLLSLNLWEQKLLLMQRRSWGILLKVLQICHVWFPRSTVCSSGSRLALPSHCAYTCWLCCKGAQSLIHAWPHLLQGQLANLVSALPTTQEWPPTDRNRAVCWGLHSSCLLPSYHLLPQTSGPTPWGDAPSLILQGGYLPPLHDQMLSLWLEDKKAEGSG